MEIYSTIKRMKLQHFQENDWNGNYYIKLNNLEQRRQIPNVLMNMQDTETER